MLLISLLAVVGAARVELEPLGKAYAKSGWTVVQNKLPDANELVTLTFAVKLQNTDRLQELFQEVLLSSSVRFIVNFRFFFRFFSNFFFRRKGVKS